MTHRTKISVVIVTKDRSNHLVHCLGSLAGQSQKPDELIVIDNNSSDQTPTLVKNFSKNTLFPVKLVKEKKIGYPVVYNRGLNEAHYNWVAFIDDDCVADKDWFFHIKETLKKNPKVAAVLGKSKTQDPKNIYSLATLFFDELWKKGSIHDNKIRDKEILDNKNIVYNKEFLKKNNISYDETRVDQYHGASEDCDLGMQIGQAGGEALFAKKVMVFHKDPDNLSWFYKKIFWGTKAHLTYEQKWQKERTATSSLLKKIFRVGRFFRDFSRKNNLSFTQTTQLSVHILFSYLLMIAIRIFEKLRV
jgi:glycosyltransferase involved in cell wall biosynthesis